MVIKLKKEKKTKKKRKLRLWVVIVLLVIFSGALIFSGLKVFSWHKDNKKIEEIKKDIEESIKPEQIEEEGELINPPSNDTGKQSDYWYYTKVPFYEVNFSELLSKNDQTVAFIHMDNTNINYPVVQTTDNDYYLTHAYDKSKNDAGWVYLDYRDTINPLSDNLVIYGHGRVNKTVFGSLKNVLTKSWQSNKDNYVIWLSTPTENFVYQIFSVYTIQSESYYIKTGFNNQQEKEEWINTMVSRNTAPTETGATVNDKILTLSTCENNSGGRIVVHAKLIKKQTR